MPSRIDLFPYQTAGAEFLAGRRRLLADEPGLGKSGQFVRACDAAGARRVLVCCPASVAENWRLEFSKFQTREREILRVDQDDPDFSDRVCVSTYERIERGSAFWSTGQAFDAMAIDEAHYLKNPKTKRTQALFGPKCDGVGGLIERTPMVSLLTGTPAPNNPSELWPMLRAVMPDAIRDKGKPMALWPFIQRYCATRPGTFGGIKILHGKNLAELRDRIAPYMLRRKKTDVLTELPPITFDTLAIPPTKLGHADVSRDALKDEFQLLKQTIEERGIEGLREIAPHVSRLRWLMGVAKVDPVVAWVKTWLAGGGGKIVLFAHHREVCAQLFTGLISGQDRISPPARITGDTPLRERQIAVDTFQGDARCRVFIGQIQAAGTGITLTAASHALFVESSWVPAENEQAAMRIHRIGQRDACLVRFATVPGSLDDQIQRACMRKASDIRKIFG